MLISLNLFAHKVDLATSEYPPFVSKLLKENGFVPEILNLIFKEIDIQPNYRFLPWKRCEAELLKGKVWAAFPYGKNAAREKRFLFSEVIFNSTSSFFYYKKKPINNWKKLSDLKPYTIGGVLGYFYETDFKKNNLKVDYAPTELSNIKKLIKGRVQLIITDDLTNWELIKKHFPEEIKNFGILPKPYDVSGNYLMVSKTYPDAKELLRKFNKTLQKLKANGLLTSILRRYKLK